MPTESLIRARLTGATPQFLVTDLAAACAFYRDKLGFAVDFTFGDFYAGISRDGVTLHLKLVDTPEPCRAFKKQGEHLDLYVNTDDVDTLYAEYDKSGVTILKPLTTTPWGTKEFAIEDASGFILYFGRRV